MGLAFVLLDQVGCNCGILRVEEGGCGKAVKDCGQNGHSGSVDCELDPWSRGGGKVDGDSYIGNVAILEGVVSLWVFFECHSTHTRQLSSPYSISAFRPKQIRFKLRLLVSNPELWQCSPVQTQCQT